MQIGSAATNPLSTQALLPASARASAPATTVSPTSPSSPDTTVSLSADGKRLAANDRSASAASDKAAASKAGNSASDVEKSPQQLQQERQTISELASRDIDVRAHEAAHASVGGAYAGSPSYTLQQGPDGKSYAVGGEVGIDLSAVAGDPAATISKMEVVARAALAPIDPSAQDLRVAAAAQGVATAARADLAQERRDESTEAAEKKREQEKPSQAATGDNPQTTDTSASLQVYQRIASPLDTTPQIVAVA